MPRGNQFGTAESANEARASLLAEWEAKRGKKSLGNQGKESDRKARPVEPLKPQGYMPDRARKSKDNVRDNAATEIRPSQIRPAPRNNRRYDRAAGAAPESARVRVAPPIAEKLARPAPRRKANRTKKRVMPSWDEWLATEDGADYRQTADKSKQQYEDGGGRRKREKEKVIEKQLAPDLNALISDDNPKATKAEKRAKKEEDENKKKAMEHYPPRDELLEQWPPPRCGPLLMSSGGVSKHEPEKWEYPKNEHQMDCAKWKKNGTCLKFEQTGWCPFNHPYDAPPIPMSGKLVCSAVAEENYKIWLEAAKAGDQELLQLLITGGPNQPKADVNYVAEPGTKGISMDLQGKSAANVCARLGHKDCLLLLLQNGAKRQKHEHEIHSLLFAAAQKSTNKEKDCEECVQICLDNRVSIAEVDDQTGQTLLHSVIDRKHYAILPYLIREFKKENAKMTSKGIGVDHLDANNFSALHVAVAKGSVEAVSVLFAAGASANTQMHVESVPCTGNSPIGIACKKGNIEIVELLLQNGANVDANAVVYASILEDQSIYALLEAANLKTKKPKALVLAKNKDRSSTVHVACCISKDDQALVALQRVVELAVEAGTADVTAFVNSQNTRGVSPLMMACRLKNMETIRHLLVEHKANAFAQDCDGNSALHHTEHIMEGSDEVILLVCKKGGGERLPEIKNNLGQTPSLPTKMGEGMSKGMEKCNNQ